MRINNKRIIPVTNIIYTFLLLGILCGILLIFVPIPAIVKHIPPPIKPFFPYLTILLFSMIIFIYKKTGPHQFEYSSDGETITIRTKDPYWVKYFPKNQRLVDFPKRKLKGFKIKKGLFLKKLDLFLESKRSKGGINRITINISYINNSEISDLKRSLHKVIQKNKEAEISTIIEEEEEESYEQS